MVDYPQERSILILAAFNGSLSELEYLDFSMLNLKFVNGYSDETKKIFTTKFINAEEILDRLKEISIIIGGYSKHMQLLIPVDFSKPVFEKDIILVEEILKIIFPCDIAMNFLDRFIITENKVSFYSGSEYSFKQSGFAHENYLKVNDTDLKNANRFIKIFLKNYSNIKYFKNAWVAYISSFHQDFKTMEYISLCIALESIVDGKSELNYRIKRNIAILIGQDKDTSNLIFKNIGKIYDLRSSIVHSSNYKNSDLEEYLPYLRDIVSVLLIELIFQNIVELTALNSILTQSGFGEKERLTENYMGFKFTNKSYSNIYSKSLS